MKFLKGLGMFLLVTGFVVAVAFGVILLKNKSEDRTAKPKPAAAEKSATTKQAQPEPLAPQK